MVSMDGIFNPFLLDCWRARHELHDAKRSHCSQLSEVADHAVDARTPPNLILNSCNIEPTSILASLSIAINNRM
jgi:hypothetical protein